MHDTEMTPFELSLANRLRAHSEIEVAPANALAIARETIATRRRSGLAASWASLRAPARAAIVVALLGAMLVGAVLVGSRLLRDPLTVTLPAPTGPVPSAAPIGGAAAADLRSRWLAGVEEIPGLGNAPGAATLTIDPSGGVVTVANLAPGSSFASTASVIGQDELGLRLINDGGGCAAGAEGAYRMTQSADRGQLTLLPLSDACSNRSAVLGRTWDRTLVGPTTVGAGIVDSFDPPFAIRLPDGTYEARTLDDFIEIGRSDGFSLMVVKNPQGFVDACRTDEVRYPYTPGASAFVEYYRQNDAFTVVEASPLQIDGHDAIHLVTKVRVEGAPCPSADLYALTPKACDCHFFGGDDSLYLVDVGPDTFLFQLSPTVDSATELPIINTIRIPYQLGQPSP
jgi:hypothetical protein